MDLTFDPALRLFFPELARCESSRELEQSSLYRKLQPEIQRILQHVWQEQLVASPPPAAGPVRVIAWNIERGMRVDGIISLLREHPQLRDADVLLLSEVDWGMARTQNRRIVRDIASALGMNYAFAPCYLALSKGAGVERQAEGENAESLHGNAVLSRCPLQHAHSLALPNGKDKMKGAEKRIGSQRALIADIEHPTGMFRAVSLHLDAHSSQAHRCLQMKQVLDHLETLQPKLPVLIGGDWNTTTHDASRALYSILGYVRRVLMGVRHVVANHYPYPEKYFERRLFQNLEQRGYNYRDLNNPGECTLHYHMHDLRANLNLGEWVPQWCFSFIRWALERTGGSCSLKLDWFAGKDVARAGEAYAVPNLSHDGRPVSDHDPIVLSVRPGGM